MSPTATANGNGNGHSTVAVIERAADDAYFHDVGTTGLVSFGGYVNEEFLPELHWPQAARVYREMSDNDPVIGAFLNAADLSIRRAERIVKPVDDSPQATEAADLCESALDDMRAGQETWADTQSNILSMLAYGFSMHEIVLKRCQGPRAEQPSKFEDGKVRVDHLPIRSQETIKTFNLDGPNPYVTQQALGHPVTDIPYEKLLHFRTRALKGNPLGYPLIRRAYTSYYRIKIIQWIESIGIERDLAGLPVARMPKNVLTGTDQNSTTLRNQMTNAVKNIRRNEAEGISLPSDKMDNNEYEFDITLLSSGGARQFDVGAVITRYEQRILMSVLADFLMLGHEGVGALGLNIGTAKIDLFLASMETICTQISSQMNRLFQLLTTLNGLPFDVAPIFEYGPLNKADIATIAGNLLKLAQAGFAIGGDPKLTNFLLDGMDLSHEDAEKMAEQAPVMLPPDQTQPLAE